jgi:hypothetical protein
MWRGEGGDSSWAIAELSEYVSVRSHFSGDSLCGSLPILGWINTRDFGNWNYCSESLAELFNGYIEQLSDRPASACSKFQQF